MLAEIKNIDAVHTAQWNAMSYDGVFYLCSVICLYTAAQLCCILSTATGRSYKVMG